MRKGKLINTDTPLISTLEYNFILLMTNNFEPQDQSNLIEALQNLQYITPDGKIIHGLYNPIPHITSIKTPPEAPLYITMLCNLVPNTSMLQIRRNIYKYLKKHNWSYDNIVPCKSQPESRLPYHYRAIIRILNNRLPKLIESIAIYKTLKKERNYKKQEFNTHIKNIMLAQSIKDKSFLLRKLRNFFLPKILQTYSGNILNAFKYKYGDHSALYRLTLEP